MISRAEQMGEDARYSELYRRGYGVGPVGDLFAWAVQWGVAFADAAVVDCGCGRATLRSLIPDARSYVGVDISSFIIETLTRQQTGLPRLLAGLGRIARLEGRQLAPRRCRFVHSPLDRIPLESEEFDIAWCCDVMEHIHPGEVDRVLEEVCRIGRRAVFSISTRPSKILDSEGGNLHLTVREADWWASRLARHGSLRETAVDRRPDTFMAILDCRRALPGP